MGIEKDIQQPNFRNEYQKMGINLLYTANWLNENIGKFLEQEEITQQQYNILRILRINARLLQRSRIEKALKILMK